MQGHNQETLREVTELCLTGIMLLIGIGQKRDGRVQCQIPLTKFVAFDPLPKRTQASLTDASGKSIMVAKGAPQSIVDLAQVPADVAQKVKEAVDQLASTGSRALGVARSADCGTTWSVLGMI